MCCATDDCVITNTDFSVIRCVNADLFRAADLSFSVECLPLNQPLSSLPVASTSRFSAVDAAFNSSIVGLHTALPLGDVVRRLTCDIGPKIAKAIYIVPYHDQDSPVTCKGLSLRHRWRQPPLTRLVPRVVGVPCRFF